MAKIGTMPMTDFGAAPLAGVPHFAQKAIPAAKAPRQNMLNVRVAPLKRLQAQVKPLKADKPDNIGNF